MEPLEPARELLEIALAESELADIVGECGEMGEDG
jgi:hypothetical protein